MFLRNIPLGPSDSISSEQQEIAQKALLDTMERCVYNVSNTTNRKATWLALEHVHTHARIAFVIADKKNRKPITFLRISVIKIDS